MFFTQELSDLRARKRILQAQSDLQRSLLEVELVQAKQNFNPAALGGHWLSRVKPFLPFAAPVAGFFLVKRWRTIAKWAGRYAFARTVRKYV